MSQHLTSSGILQAWEAGVSRRPLDRALCVLWAAGVPGDLAGLSLAERDRLLLGVRAATFGPDIAARATCPDCGEDLEMTFDAHVLSAALPEATQEVVTLGGQNVVLRALNSRDLAEAALSEDVASVLRGCATGHVDVDDAILPELDGRIEARESAAQLTARLACVACDAAWKDVLDVVGLIWSEIEAAAHRLLEEIAEIASALSWSERDILALSEARRAAYLGLSRQR